LSPRIQPKEAVQPDNLDSHRGKGTRLLIVAPILHLRPEPAPRHLPPTEFSQRRNEWGSPGFIGQPYSKYLEASLMDTNRHKVTREELYQIVWRKFEDLDFIERKEILRRTNLIDVPPTELDLLENEGKNKHK